MKTKQTIIINTTNVEVLTEILYQGQTKLSLFALAKSIGVSCDAVKYATAANVAKHVSANGGAEIKLSFKA